ncbi:endolytic transglycosylase MltG [Pontivivens insulae]|uniref:Endolytic murein transglycosylase n=1 Tax=Pontivivens insulae TaxID=1639689 RepID=A0A2R8AAA3_9RHOB|nr:endolytic transglycosylase MltG [Pontivivens insulae]RED13074.1 UPF0755 protein [Pontivivens insulae]SPF29166.1 Endolytic murein transglycosylase [Pontivivens insulae]
MKNIASNALTFLIVGLIALGGVIGYGQNAFYAPGPLERPVCLQVNRGASVEAIGQSLQELGALENPTIFRIGARYTGKGEDRRFGNFLLPANVSMDEALDIVTAGGQSTCGAEVNFRIGVTRFDILARELDPASGDYVEVARWEPGVDEQPEAFEALRDEDPDLRYRVTVAEGTTSWQVREGLNAVPWLEGEIAEVPAEGTLAPDSYEFRVGDDRAGIIAQMEERQARLLADAWENRQPGLPLDSAEQLLTLASIVEKETSLPSERGTVAAVFINRLNRDMPLQTDPTVIYGITNGEGVLGRGLRRSELDRATPYNTYQIQGLPPGPIANPGRDAIAAAANPVDSEFIFFVADGTGGHAFAVTYEEHQQNVARWREIEAERAE